MRRFFSRRHWLASTARSRCASTVRAMRRWPTICRRVSSMSAPPLLVASTFAGRAESGRVL
eukprot:8923985-Pyramimonas_sp.AAC.1